MPKRRTSDPRIVEHIDSEDWQKVRESFAGLHPADIADIIDRSPAVSHAELFSLLSKEIKPQVLAELESTAESEIMEALDDRVISDLVSELAPDDAADIMAHLPRERSLKILGMLETEEAEDIRLLMGYGEETAGGIMTTDVVAMHENQTVGEALNAIAYLDTDEKFLYAYIIDDQRRLIGHADIWSLLREQDKKRPLGELVNKDFIAANVDVDQEEVVRLIDQYDLNTLPVIDNAGRLVGRITADDVIDVMEDEASEDIFRLAGSDDMELDNYSALKRSMIRLPWLLITLLGGLLIAIIHKSYQEHIVGIAILASFIPSILAMGGNTGIQSSTLVVRRIALGTLKNADIGRLLMREALTGMMMGSVCSIIIATGAFAIGLDTTIISPYQLAFTVGFALFCAMTFAASFGALVPILLNRIKVDPAIASGPFITITNDIAALLIYFLITILLIQHVVS